MPRLRRRDQTRNARNVEPRWPVTWRARARNTIVSVVVLTPFTGDACGGRVFVVMIIINAFYFYFQVTDNRFPGGETGGWGGRSYIYSLYTAGDRDNREGVVAVMWRGTAFEELYGSDKRRTGSDCVCADEGTYTLLPALWVMSPAGVWRACVTYRCCIISLWCGVVVVVINLLLYW